MLSCQSVGWSLVMGLSKKVTKIMNFYSQKFSFYFLVEKGITWKVKLEDQAGLRHSLGPLILLRLWMPLHVIESDKNKPGHVHAEVCLCACACLCVHAEPLFFPASILSCLYREGWGSLSSAASHRLIRSYFLEGSCTCGNINKHSKLCISLYNN